MNNNPYCFVPFDPKKVYYPAWGPFISQDLPFEDGQSGVLEISIENHSPLFIRDGELAKILKEGEKLPPSDKGFCIRNNGQYFIPGSSLKGMIRSAMEIMSFGKMNFVNDHRYSVRDLNNKEVYMNRIAEPKVYTDQDPHPIRCGWLRKDADNKYIIEDCGQPYKIDYHNIDKLFKTDMYNLFTQKIEGYRDNKDECKTALFKYKRYQTKVYPSGELFEPFWFSRKVKSNKSNKGKNTATWETQYDYDLKGQGQGEQGILVMTGQPAKRVPKLGDKKASGKIRDFIFLCKEKPEELSLSAEVVQNFKFAYFDHDPKQQGEDWKMMRERLKQGKKLPVFFTREGKTSGPVLHFGLSFLYKLPYDNKVTDYLQGQKHRPDLPECIFGHISNDYKNETHTLKGFLKGRVHIGHAQALGKVQPMAEVSNILASPKASFYPYYLEQPNPKSYYKTFMNGDAKLAGFKRYLTQKGEGVFSNTTQAINKAGQAKVNDKVGVRIKALAPNTKFTARISYHNLRPEELGALISALTLHNHQQAYHRLGMAKPLGYGKLKIRINNLSEEEQKQYLTTFEKSMNRFVQEQSTQDKIWLKTPSIKTFFASTYATEEKLEYPKLADFRTIKKLKTALQTDNDVQLNTALSKEAEGLDAFERVFEQYEALCEEVEEQKQNNPIKLGYISVLKKRLKKDFQNAENKAAKKEIKRWIRANIENWFGSDVMEETLNYLTENP